jgi:polysaccharide deacetylase 2 family uncharacterized protein YibQ
MRPLAIVAGLFFVAVAGLFGAAVVLDDPMGGEPYVLVRIDSRPPEATRRKHGDNNKSAVARKISTRNINNNEVRSDKPKLSRSVGNRNTARPKSPDPLEFPDKKDNRQKGRTDTPLGHIPPVEEPKLQPAPIAGLVVETPQGILPKINATGYKPAVAYARPHEPGISPRVAVLVTGLGLSEMVSEKAVELLPGAVSLAFVPYSRNLQNWSDRARADGHETVLQLPMEPLDYPDSDPGPHALVTIRGIDENIDRLHWLMTRFSGYVGVVNYMGGHFMARAKSLGPVMEEIEKRGLLMLDDGSNGSSAASKIASRTSILFARADMYLDAAQSVNQVDDTLQQVEVIAKKRGLAILVADGSMGNLARIKSWLTTLSESNIELVPLTTAVLKGAPER